MPRNRVRAGGFTLVELLVVISIIALLASFILPGLSRAREYAYFSRCKNNLKQIGIGFNTFAVNNKGRFPEGESRHPTTNTYTNIGRKIGIKEYRWYAFTRTDGSSGDAGSYPLKSLLFKVYYKGIKKIGWHGDNWAGVGGNPIPNWVGYPRLPGLYLPIEILWCPITKVRDWRPYGSDNPGPTVKTLSGTTYTYHHAAGTEKGRDFLSRAGNILGYEFFVVSVGCTPQHYRSHTLQQLGGTASSQIGKYGEEGLRPATRNRPVDSAAKPSAWLAADQTPFTNPPASGHTKPRYFASHFGYRDTVPSEWRFNVVHLDGHVDDRIWKEVSAAKYWLTAPADNGPYGWEWVNPSGNDTKSLEGIRIQSHMVGNGAFDRNAGQ